VAVEVLAVHMQKQLAFALLGKVNCFAADLKRVAARTEQAGNHRRLKAWTINLAKINVELYLLLKLDCAHAELGHLHEGAPELGDLAEDVLGDIGGVHG
jgi:hypothetical protein